MNTEPHYNDLLRKVEEVLVIDVYPYASSIPDNLLATLNPPTEGLYIKGSFKPIIEKNGKYYHGNSKEPLNFEDIINTKRNVYNEVGDLKLDASIYNSLKRQYTTEPPVFGTAMNMATTVALKTLDELSRYFKPSPNVINYHQHVLPEFHYLIDKNEYDEVFHPIARKVIDFVNNNNWNLFFHRVKGNALIIERGIDWRIYDWHRIQYEQSNPDSE